MEDDWTTSANDALTISLVRPGVSSDIETITSFNPRFTYPIFGEEEQIFGYKGLKINLKYDARDLRPNLTVSCARKYPTVGDVEALDIKEKLKEFLPPVAFQSKNEYEQAVKGLSSSWVPPGRSVGSFEKNGEIYEIWHGMLNDPAVKQLLQRIQIVALFYIEGATYTGEDAEGNVEPEYSLARWSVFFVYKKEIKPEVSANPRYIFQGYSTVYNFWVFQASALQGDLQALLPGGPRSADRLMDVSSHRMRISQFLILPPFQGKGIGASLYNTIFGIGMKDRTAMEVAIEDPNEDFDLLRDLCDLKYLRKNVPEFVDLKINTDVAIPQKGGILHNDTRITSHRESSGSFISSPEGIVDLVKLELLRQKTKIARRQFWRLVEMHLMSKLPESVRPQLDVDAKKPRASEADKHAYTLWRLVLKQRLYRRNISQLGEFGITERIIKLNETVANVEWEYAVILDRLESKPPAIEDSTAADGKRKLNNVKDVEVPSSKKART
ncbi:hypothetical protein Hte_003028 [Hypoxylon texense]